MRNRLLVLSCGALLFAACSSDDNDSDSSPTTTEAVADATTTTAGSESEFPPELTADGEVLFAETINGFVINTVLAYGEQGLDPRAIADAFTEVYPTLSVRGYEVEADGTNISFWSTVRHDKDVPSADNPYIVAVATRQVSGECFGSAVYGYPLPTERFDVVDLEDCTAHGVIDQLVMEVIG